MSTLQQKPTSLDQKQNRNLSKCPLSTQSTLSSNAAPRNLRLICDQIAVGNAGIQAHIRELSNAAAAITEGISALKAQLTRESHRFHAFRIVLASFLGRPMPIVSAGTVGLPSPARTAPMRASSEENRIGATYTPTKVKKRSSRANDEDEVDNSPRKRRRLPLDAYKQAYVKFRSQEDISTFKNPDSPSDPRLSPSLSPASTPTNYLQPKRPASPHPKSRPPSRMMPHTDWFYTKYDFRRKHWLFVRDRRATKKWKLIEEKEQKVIFGRDGNLQINLEQCCRAVDTTYGFQVVWRDYDVPYAGDDNVLTPSHPDYPEYLRSEPPPERRDK
ncbi:hypothetical protein CPC08DRAFT_821612 [Agrocybe pediades]|nr:hypothetical protein CPC08DRAFT_821612 [Agrocybe pediades]